MRPRFIRTATLSLLALFVPALSSASDRDPMKNGPTLTAKEANRLIEAAKTAMDHLKLAPYFNQQADQYEADARDHDAMIEAYRKNPTPWAIKTPRGVRTIEHCEYLAKSDRERAKALREMASAHEAIARAAEGQR